MFRDYRNLLYALPLSIALVFSSIAAKADNSERKRTLQKKHDELLCKIQNTNIFDIENYARFVNYNNKTGVYFSNQIPVSDLDDKADLLVLTMFFNDYLQKEEYYKDREQKELVDEQEKQHIQNWSIGTHNGYFLGTFSTKDLKRPIYELCDLKIPKIIYQSTELVSLDDTLEQLLGAKIETKTYEISAINLGKYLKKISELRDSNPLLPESNKDIRTLVTDFFRSWTRKGLLGEQKNKISITEHENGCVLGLQPQPSSKKSKKEYNTMILVSPGEMSESSLVMKCIKSVDPEPFSQIPRKFKNFINGLYLILGERLINALIRKN